MPAFPIKSTQQLADYLIPVTPEIATEIIAQASDANDGTAYVAVYYTVENRETGKRKRASLAVTFVLELETDGVLGFVWTDEYHPRTNKADTIYKTDTIILD